MCPLADFQKQRQWLYYLLGKKHGQQKVPSVVWLFGTKPTFYQVTTVAPPLLSSTRRFSTADQYVSGALPYGQKGVGIDEIP